MKKLSFPSFPEEIIISPDLFNDDKNNENEYLLKKIERYVNSIKEIAEELGMTSEVQNIINKLYDENITNGIHNHSVQIKMMLLELETYYKYLKVLKNKKFQTNNNEEEVLSKKNKLLEVLNLLITRELPTKERLYSQPRVDNLKRTNIISESLKQLDDIFIKYKNLDYDAENHYFQPEIINKLREVLHHFNLSELELKAFLIEHFKTIREVTISNSMFILNSCTNAEHNIKKI